MWLRFLSVVRKIGRLAEAIEIAMGSLLGGLDAKARC
jgi:hypothetical protein